MKLLNMLNFSVRRRAGNASVKIPVLGGTKVGLSAEPWMTGLLETVLPEFPGVFLDVGVNLGQTLVKVKSIEPHREYIGFEPNPECVAYVRRLMKLNQYSGTVIPIGLGQDDGIRQLDFFNESAVDSSASMVDPGVGVKTSVSSIHIPVFRFDHVKPLVPGKIGIVKIDVEGGECEVVQGLRDALSESRAPVILEILPVYDASNHERLQRQQTLETTFRELDYVLHRVCKSATNTFTGFQRVDEIGVHSEINFSDYLALPSDIAPPA